MTEQEFDELVSRPLEREVHERQLELMRDGVERQEARKQASQELDYNTRDLREAADRHLFESDEGETLDGTPNWGAQCSVCGAVPTVGPLRTCGPCTFGDAGTAGGNW